MRTTLSYKNPYIWLPYIHIIRHGNTRHGSKPNMKKHKFGSSFEVLGRVQIAHFSFFQNFETNISVCILHICLAYISMVLTSEKVKEKEIDILANKKGL